MQEVFSLQCLHTSTRRSVQLADTAVLMFTSCHTVSSGFSARVGAHRFLHSGTTSGCSSPKRKQLPGEFSHSQACGGFLSNKVVVSGKCICHLVAGFFVFLQICVFSVCFFNLFPFECHQCTLHSNCDSQTALTVQRKHDFYVILRRTVPLKQNLVRCG